MKLIELIEFIRARMKIVIFISYAILALLIIADGIPIIVDKEHAHTILEHLPGFWSIFGFIACTLIIFASKLYGYSGVMQREDYYDV